MRKLLNLTRFTLILVLGASIFANIYSPQTVQAQSGKLPLPCKLDSAAVYMVVDSTRRHIVDWDTFLNLGYKAADIVPCGDAGKYPEGASVTRLIKGSGADIYWMENGVRRHIPDMATFDAMGFKAANVTMLPDAVVGLWPLGDPLTPRANPTVAEQRTIGNYTVQLIKEGSASSYALISAPGQRTVKVPYIYAIGSLPAADVTGDGNPDVLLLRNDIISLFGIGTVVYNLGVRPTKVLDVNQIYHATTDTGQGEFRDLNGDGAYEFITKDVVNTGRLSCILVNVPVVLQYSSARRRYISANRRFPDFYNNLIASHQANPATQCDAIVILLYVNRTTEAKALFDQLYPTADSSMWTDVLKQVRRGRYYR